TPHPGVVGRPEKPKPGSEGATTWNASAASPPKAVGFVSGSKTLWNSTIEPGHPCERISGSAPSCGDRTCTKWMSSPSTSVTYWSKRFSFSSLARQSYVSAQYDATSRTYPSGIPCDQSSTTSASPHRVLRRRALRSSRSPSGTLIVNGRTEELMPRTVERQNAMGDLIATL